jgi:hypothetical protein
MKTGLLLVLLLVLSGATAAQQKTDLGLPELNVVKTAVLSPIFGCSSTVDFRKGYGETALFLSGYSREMNSPDLLFEGACQSEDYFAGPRAGDDMSLVADLGDVPLDQVSSSRAFNFKRVHSFDRYSRFAQEARVQSQHTYALLINTRDLRALLVFRVEDYQPNSKVSLTYAVRDYQLLQVKGESKGFDWEAENRAAETQWVF